MQVYYLADCDAAMVHTCSNCGESELGRIRHVAVPKTSYDFTDITSTAEWQQAIEDDEVEVIPNVHGSFTSTVVEGPGYGDQSTSFLTHEFVLTFFDKEFSANCEFYNSLAKTRNRKLIFVTEDKIFISDKAVVFLPSMNIQDDDQTNIEWNVQVKWRGRTLPCGSAIPEDIFACFAEEAA